jgi:7-keto-8-aminopelargonate synthetase-like enzyme
MAGNSVCAVALSQKLFEREINVQPIIHPAVPERAARLRFFLTSEHSTAQIDTALAAIEDAMQEIDSSPLLQKIPGFVKSGET